MQLLGILNQGHRAGDALVAAAGIDNHRQLTAIHPGIRTGCRLCLGTDGHIISVGRQQSASDVGTVVPQKSLLCNGIVAANLPLQNLLHVTQICRGGKIPDVRHIQHTPVGAALINLRLAHRLFQQHLTVLFNQNDVGVEVRNPNLCPAASLERRHLEVKHMTPIDVLNFNLHPIQIFLDGLLLRGGHLGDDLQFLIRHASHNARRSGGTDALEVTGVGDNHAFHIFNNAAADLEQHPVRQRPQNGSCLGGGIGQRNRLGAAHGGNQFFL